MDEFEKRPDHNDADEEERGGEATETEETTDEDDKKLSSCVYLSLSAFDYIDDYARSDTNKEIGGFLLGNYTGEKDNFRVWVEAAVEASYTETSGSGLRFTHRTWEHVVKIRDRDYPGCRIIGWFHTHPGVGTYISKSDLFMHEVFFDSFWQVSYVIDPLSREHAFYGWDKYNRLAPISFKLEGEPLYIALTKEERFKKDKEQKLKKKKKNDFLGVGKTAAAFVGLILVFYLLNYYVFLFPQKEAILDLQLELENKNELIEALQDENNELTKLFGPDEAVEPVDEDSDGINNDEDNRDNRSPSPDSGTADSGAGRTYTVGEGDTLWRISDRLLGNGSRYQEIAELNGIEPPYAVDPGTVLKIPAN
jgi:proteasome lid subunit RPN8/RPN11